MGEHARLGYSNKRWPACPASPDQESQYEDIAGEAAIDGTGTHLLLEMCLLEGVNADFFEGEVIGVNHEDKPNGWVVHADRCERAQMCLDYIAGRVEHFESQGFEVEVQAESRSNVGQFYGRDDWWGTSDVVIVVRDQNGTVIYIEVVDYKDGRGYVHESDNSQLLGNLGGWLFPYADTVQTVRMTIVQPRTGKPVRFQETNPAYVKSKLDELAKAAARTDAEEPEYVPDDKLGKGHCRWCKHQDNCTALLRKQQEPLMSSDLSIIPNLDFGNLSSISSSELVRIARKEKDLGIAFKKIHKELERRHNEGQEVEGTAFESVSSKRVWAKSDAEIKKMLRNRKVPVDRFEVKSLATPTQVLALDCLTDKQKEQIEKEFVTTVMGKEKFIVKPEAKETPRKKMTTLEMFGGVKAKPAMPSFK